MKELLLGIDIGTSGCKVTVIDFGGRIVDSAFGEIATAHPWPGWSEQAPEDWFDIAARLLREIFEGGRCAPGQIAALSLDGSTHNAALVDQDFRPIRPAIMWTDQRSVRQAADLEREAGDFIFQTAYQRPTATWTLPQLVWIAETEPQSIGRMAHFLFQGLCALPSDGDLGDRSHRGAGEPALRYGEEGVVRRTVPPCGHIGQRTSAARGSDSRRGPGHP